MDTSRLKENKALQIKLFGLLLNHPNKSSYEDCLINLVLTKGDKTKTAKICCSCFYCERGEVKDSVHVKKDVLSCLLKDFPYLLKYFPSYLLEEKI